MKAIEDLVSLLTRLPGIGRKSALRIAYSLLKSDIAFSEALADHIRTLRSTIHFCAECGSYAESELCQVCSDASRDRSIMCVVEQPQDVITIEASKEYKGLYHVLGGLLSPLEGVGPDKLNIGKLIQRIHSSISTSVPIREIIIATNPTIEGDTTALYLKKLLEKEPVKVTRLATGIPVGGDLEYADRLTLARSFHGRSAL
ncbi:MAG: recombination mediator RecR [Spirochaetia bacterium]|jgi:recombination protein RecR|uniref:Recombination protein RecR n=1 Tax=uncultured spirochete TaxID=156406 RepID=A0A3P3XIW0_9SPIR|nr:recombination mediator RecR [Rectinema subterraneum]MDQ7796714.1 recombination mediator RecR [Spirochaetia bacterium]SLM13070.1 gap repair protein [uncultured spirochete]HBE46535.1 recombination protein RecR [Spirochaetaceae bacterium]